MSLVKSGSRELLSFCLFLSRINSSVSISESPSESEPHCTLCRGVDACRFDGTFRGASDEEGGVERPFAPLACAPFEDGRVGVDCLLPFDVLCDEVLLARFWELNAGAFDGGAPVLVLFFVTTIGTFFTTSGRALSVLNLGMASDAELNKSADEPQALRSVFVPVEGREFCLE
jgi:hypothetical protein